MDGTHALADALIDAATQRQTVRHAQHPLRLELEGWPLLMDTKDTLLRSHDPSLSCEPEPWCESGTVILAGRGVSSYKFLHIPGRFLIDGYNTLFKPTRDPLG